jgi:hypothetical protein
MNCCTIKPGTPKNRPRFEAHGDTPTLKRRVGSCQDSTIYCQAVHPLSLANTIPRYRIALDEVAGLPKKLAGEGKSLDGQPPFGDDS